MRDINYLEGYKDALKFVDTELQRAIKANGGMSTWMQQVNVFNSIIAGLHIERARTQERIEEIESYEMPSASWEDLVNMIDSTFPLAQINIYKEEN